MACLPPMYPSATTRSGSAHAVTDPIITPKPTSPKEQQQQQTKSSPRHCKVNVAKDASSRTSPDISASTKQPHRTRTSPPVSPATSLHAGADQDSPNPHTLGSSAYSPRSPCARKIRSNGFQPNRNFTVTHTYKASQLSALSTAQVGSWEAVATPRPDLHHQNQVAAMKQATAETKKARVAKMIHNLELSRKSHQIHLQSLVNEGGHFQRRVLANDGLASPRYQRPDALMAMGAATLKAQGMPCVNPYRKETFMLACKPKLWQFLLTDIATLLVDPGKVPADEELASPKFVADQVHGLILFQQSNFVNEA